MLLSLPEHIAVVGSTYLEFAQYRIAEWWRYQKKEVLNRFCLRECERSFGLWRKNFR